MSRDKSIEFFIRPVASEEGSYDPEIFCIDFNILFDFLPENRNLLGFYCKASMQYCAFHGGSIQENKHYFDYVKRQQRNKMTEKYTAFYDINLNQM